MGISVLGLEEVLSLLHQVFICGAVVFPEVRQFWDIFQSKLVEKDPYTTSIESMRIRLPEFQDDNKEAKKLILKRLLEGYKDIEQMFHY